MGEVVPTVHRLWLTRDSAFGLQVGGVGRVTVWFDEPTPREHVFELGGQVLSRNTILGSDSHRGLTGKAFLKLDKRPEGMAEKLWQVVVQTAFPGIPWDEWTVDGSTVETAHAVPENVWIGHADLLVSQSPFEGGHRVTMTVTGPFPENRMWSGDLEASVEDVIVWFTPPHFQKLEGWDPDPFTRQMPIPFWSGNGYSMAPWLSLRDLEQLGVDSIAAGVRRAVEAEFGRSANAVVGRSWSTSFEMWMAVENGLSGSRLQADEVVSDTGTGETP